MPASGFQVFNISLDDLLLQHIGRMVDFEDEEFDEPSAMVQLNTPDPTDLNAFPEQRTILRMRYFKTLIVQKPTYWGDHHYNFVKIHLQG